MELTPQDLHLHGDSIGDEGVCSLMSGLSSHKGKIAFLDSGNNSISAKGAFYVAEYIKKSKNLLWLNLYMNDLGGEGAERIADALKANHIITTIDLGGNNIRAKGVPEIAQALKDNTVISTVGHLVIVVISFSFPIYLQCDIRTSCSFSLELGYNPIGSDGAKTLSEVLKFHRNVKALKLGWCQVGPKGAEFIANLWRYNNSIQF
ncbi:hypothetical protein SLEP1_g32632 [Rubroshorea leprosula]|uniref:Uncharacterized protein n=1 Tax=Rubroshorea leprosula TaxID=152421 RepID=A0AAV5KDY2_9ROSI|nr:hypothetical protein SLEP1_g32632 [Rubroshorea leprosula]